MARHGTSMLHFLWLFLIGIGLVQVAQAEAWKEATHKQAFTIKPTIDGQKVTLETFCVGPRGQLWMACRVAAKGGGSDKGMMMCYDPSGLLFDSFPLSFVPQAINFSPSSRMYVAGQGKVARVALNGMIEVIVDAPNLGNREEAVAQARKEMEKEIEEVNASMATQKKKIEEQIAKLQEAPADESEKDKTKRERRLKVLEAQFKAYDSRSVDFGSPSDEDLLQRLLSIPSIAATDNEVFVACPEQTGYGYGVWRMSPDLTVEQKIINDAHGCCGQFDIQSDGEKLIMAENSKFEVGFYDRDGKRLAGFGKRATDGQDGFGSCCNPMNVRCLESGEILTAESSIGHIKRFNRDGKLLGFIGTAKIAGGCKHVSIGFDPARNYYYMMHQDASHVAVLVLKEEAPEETEDEKLTRQAMEGLGKKLIGTWDLQPDDKTKKSAKDEASDNSMDSYVTSMFSHVEFAPDGTLVHGEEKSKSTAILGKEIDAIKESAGLVLSETPKSKWNAIRQDGDKLEMITIQDQVPGFGAIVEFADDENAKFTFFYSNPASTFGSFNFKRSSYDACGQNCSDGKKCSNEASKSEFNVETEKASSVK